MLLIHERPFHETVGLLQDSALPYVVTRLVRLLLVLCALHLPFVVLALDRVPKLRSARLLWPVSWLARLPSLGVLVPVLELVLKDVYGLLQVLPNRSDGVADVPLGLVFALLVVDVVPGSSLTALVAQPLL